MGPVWSPPSSKTQLFGPCQSSSLRGVLPFFFFFFKFLKVCSHPGPLKSPEGGGEEKPSIHLSVHSLLPPLLLQLGVGGELMPLCKRGQEWRKRGG